MSRRGSIETLALRLHPGSDVRQALKAFAKTEKIGAGVIMGAVGSLSKTCLRFANQKTPTELAGRHEILTLSGTLGEAGVHLHMMVANSQGECKGGHVVDGCQIYTTLELVIALMPEVKFKRVFDPETGCQELDISSFSERS